MDLPRIRSLHQFLDQTRARSNCARNFGLVMRMLAIALAYEEKTRTSRSGRLRVSFNMPRMPSMAGVWRTGICEASTVRMISSFSDAGSRLGRAGLARQFGLVSRCNRVWTHAVTQQR
jgi:hypothetical protein